MKRIKVDLGKRGYSILIGKGILPKLPNELKQLKLGKVGIIVTNPTIDRLYGRILAETIKSPQRQLHFIKVPDSETSKSTHQCIKLIERCADLDKGKGVFIIAFGGGVIGDLSGFAASVYRRGIPYIQIPTTLLAQVDSSIGGKVAIDLPCGKNLIGSFYQPRLVLSEIGFLNSLKPAQIKQALAEIIKYGVISDSRFFQFLEKNIGQILKLNQSKIKYVVEVCSQIKTRIIEQDETDRKDKRIILNFGHTTAHALEAAAGYAASYAHGNAVALGMLVAGEIAKELNMIPEQLVKRLETLISRAGLPTRISRLKLANILKAQEYDKKFRGGKNRFVLPLAIGKVITKEGIDQKVITKAVKSRMSK